jgi:hypothetical protein
MCRFQLPGLSGFKSLMATFMVVLSVLLNSFLPSGVAEADEPEPICTKEVKFNCKDMESLLDEVEQLKRRTKLNPNHMNRDELLPLLERLRALEDKLNGLGVPKPAAEPTPLLPPAAPEVTKAMVDDLEKRINDALGALTKRVDDHEGRIRDLEDQMIGTFAGLQFHGDYAVHPAVYEDIGRGLYTFGARLHVRHAAKNGVYTDLLAGVFVGRARFEGGDGRLVVGYGGRWIGGGAHLGYTQYGLRYPKELARSNYRARYAGGDGGLDLELRVVPSLVISLNGNIRVGRVEWGHHKKAMVSPGWGLTISGLIPVLGHRVTEKEVKTEEKSEETTQPVVPAETPAAEPPGSLTPLGTPAPPIEPEPAPATDAPPATTPADSTPVPPKEGEVKKSEGNGTTVTPIVDEESKGEMTSSPP